MKGTRKVFAHLQPEVLHKRLQGATVVQGDSDATLQGVRLGVPHGVEDAIVFMEDLRIDFSQGFPVLYFCETQRYLVLAGWSGTEDNQDYPSLGRTFLSTCNRNVPSKSGLHTALARVSINGSLTVHIEKFDVRRSDFLREARQLEAALA